METIAQRRFSLPWCVKLTTKANYDKALLTFYNERKWVMDWEAEMEDSDTSAEGDT